MIRLLLALALSALLVGCGSSDGKAPDDDPSPTASAEPEPYLDVPDGVELTEQGSGLQVGETAVVAWQPRENVIGALEVKVTDLQLTTWRQFSGWQLDAETRAMSPYFVHAKIKNVGDTQLGDVQVPLYGLDTTGVPIEPSVFTERFGPCPGNGVFPKKLAPQSSVTVCLAYLVEAGRTLRAVIFRPTQEFDQITWTGPIEKPGAKKSTKSSTKARPKQ